MSGPYPRRAAWIVFAVALLALVWGWHSFWFLTDDAYIAFRYVSNSQLGHGYVWNAPPFAPVEGYTSFLWVALLDGTWTITGVEPPVSSNWLALGFAAGSLALTAALLSRMALCAKLAGFRVSILAAALLGVVSNPNFLTWSSSGLETALFNFLALAWVAACLTLAPASRAWVLCLSASAGLMSLSRPDGLLFVAASGVLLVWTYFWRGPRLTPVAAALSAPLSLSLFHLAWRRAFYGEWLPNTYYAKHLGAWPESGVRYLGSYLLEYGLWLWLGLGIAALYAGIRGAGTRVSERGLRADLLRPELAVRAVVVAAVLAHVGYYTFIIGGDHFEYRVYSHTVPLVLLTSVWFVDRLVRTERLGPRGAVAWLLAIVLVAWPLPWTIWVRSQAIEGRSATFHLRIPMAPELPPGLQWYGRSFDALQKWLIVGHAVGKRRREHQQFHAFQVESFPRRRILDPKWSASHAVFVASSIGLPGWSLASVDIIDRAGLNDRVVARHEGQRHGSRRMAHDRTPPEGYVECFRPNVQVFQGRVAIAEREHPLTDDEIRNCEESYRRQ